MKTAKELAQEIYAFLAQYGKRCADEPEEWNSPDACCMEAVAKELESRGHVRRLPFTSWESGGYGPYTSKKGKAMHDALILQMKSFFG